MLCISSGNVRLEIIRFNIGKVLIIALEFGYNCGLTSKGFLCTIHGIISYKGSWNNFVCSTEFRLKENCSYKYHGKKENIIQLRKLSKFIIQNLTSLQGDFYM